MSNKNTLYHSYYEYERSQRKFKETDSVVYQIHYHLPIGSEKHKAQHYIGTTTLGELRDRLNEHWTGKSDVAITKEFFRRKIPFTLVNLWPGDRKTERWFKKVDRWLRKDGGMGRLCPICQGRMK